MVLDILHNIEQLFLWRIHSIWSSVVLIEGGTQSTSIGNSFSCDTICWVWMWNLARPSSNRFNWNTMSWKCLLSKSSNLTKTSDLMLANCFLARALHLRTNLKLDNRKSKSVARKKWIHVLINSLRLLIREGSTAAAETWKTYIFSFIFMIFRIYFG